jgi:hypothetical protein
MHVGKSIYGGIRDGRSLAEASAKADGRCRPAMT